MELCAGFTSEQWRSELRPRLDKCEEAAWGEAIAVFERRMSERFLRCIDILLQSENDPTNSKVARPGFAIMALSCLFVETLQTFYEPEVGVVTAEPCTYPTGRCSKDPSTARAFKEFLKNSKRFNGDFKNSKIRGDFSAHVRNALLHDAETRHGWLIERTIPKDRIVDRIDGGYVLNRTEFYRALFGEFRDYLARLRDSSQERLRANFLKKMDKICNTEPGIK